MKNIASLLPAHCAVLTFLVAAAATALAVNQGEPPDFPNTTAGTPFVLTNGTNTFSGTLDTTGNVDPQDRFNVTVPTGKRITLATKTFAPGGSPTVQSPNISFNGEDLSGTGPGTFTQGYPLGQGTLTIQNSIVAGNTSGAAVDIYHGLATLTRVGANLVQSQGADAGAPSSGPAFNTANPLLAPLGEYGGPTRTMALLLGSPARNQAVGNLVTNGNEWVARTNPANPASYLRFTQVTLTGNTVDVTFPTAVGRPYNVEFSPNLVTWPYVAGSDVTGTGNPITVPLGAFPGFDNIFLRLRVGQ